MNVIGFFFFIYGTSARLSITTGYMLTSSVDIITWYAQKYGRYQLGDTPLFRYFSLRYKPLVLMGLPLNGMA